MCQLPMSRREWLKLASMFTVAGAAPLLGALSARAATDPNAPVRIGYLPITDATPLLVAHNNGYFEAAGLAVEKPTLLRSWAQLVEAFLSGQVNVVHLLAPMTIWARYGSQAPAKVESRHWLGADRVAGHRQGRRPRRKNSGGAVLVLNP
jgi:NitT/TauT family transport system substrate-binding protein